MVWRALCLTGPLVLGFGITTLHGATPQDGAVRASVIETAELRGASESFFRADSDTISAWTKFLEMHPSNRPARLERARLRVLGGDVAGATQDLQDVESRSPNFESLIQVKISLAEVTGDTRGQRELWAKLATPEGGLLAPAFSPGEVKAHVLEVTGDYDGAEKQWAEQIKQANGAFREELADFHMRRAEYDKAIREFQDVIASRPRDDSPDSAAYIRLKLAASFWAGGKVDEALKAATSAWTCLEDGEETGSRDSLLVAPTALMVNALTTLSNKSRDNSERAFARVVAASRKHRVTARFGYDFALIGLTSPESHAACVDDLIALHKTAPFLDSALWCNTYLIVASSEDRARLAPNIPKGTVQYDILAHIGSTKGPGQ